MTDSFDNPLRTLRTRSTRANTVTQAVYALLATHCFLSLRDWRIWFGAPLNLNTVWPVAWLSTETAAAVWLLATIAGLFTAVAAVVLTDSRSVRIVSAACLLLHFAVEDSRDTVRHGEHGLLWVSLIFACLPASPGQTACRRMRLRQLRVFGTAQFMVLLFYWMAGVVKVLTSVAQGVRGERTLLHPDAGALIVAEWLLRGDMPSLMGRWLVEHRLIAWLSVLGGVLLELLAVTPLFWYRMQSVIGIGLIAMHVGIGLSMDVWFPENVALLGLLILAGPPLQINGQR